MIGFSQLKRSKERICALQFYSFFILGIVYRHTAKQYTGAKSYFVFLFIGILTQRGDGWLLFSIISWTPGLLILVRTCGGLQVAAQVLNEFLKKVDQAQPARPIPTPARPSPASVLSSEVDGADGATKGKLDSPNRFGLRPYPDRYPYGSQTESPAPPSTVLDTPSTAKSDAEKPATTSPAETSQDGSIQVQPVVPPASEEEIAAGTLPDTLEQEDPDWEIPELGDEEAPKPALGVHHVSPDAIRQRAKRIFTPRADGSLKVSQKIFEEWKGKGKERKCLEQIFKQCGYDADSLLNWD